MRPIALIGVALMGGSGALAEPPTEKTTVFDVRFLRVEGASVGLRRAADSVFEISKISNDSNRLSHIASLRSAANDLHVERMATSMALAALEAEASTPQTTENPSD